MIVTFGEIMLRLKSPGFERLLQSPSLEATFGGGEANAAVSLANYGEDVRFATVLPEGDLGDACLRELRAFGVDVKGVVRAPGRMGIYFLETGACQRPSKVIYDRADSAFCRAKPGDIDWESVLADADGLHVSGITPAISEGCAALALEGVRAAKARGVHVSCDLNYRGKLWKWGRSATDVMSELCRFVDTVTANEEDIQKCLGLHAEDSGDVEGGALNAAKYRELCEKVMRKFANVKRVCVTLRESKSADHNDFSACLYNGSDFWVSRRYAIGDIVDRVGAGDSFSGGLLYALRHESGERDALEFAVAAACLKHSIPGDFNRVSAAEVRALAKGAGTGRVQR